MASTRETGGPIVKTGPTAGKVRSRNKNGTWRKKRADAGYKRKWSDFTIEFLKALAEREKDGTLGKISKHLDDDIF